MRKTLLITAAAALGLAGGALAAEFSEVDADADGLVSLEEAQEIMPSITQDEFSTYDGDADGALNEDEFAIMEEGHAEEQGRYEPN